jgi:nitrate/TMAO reductase-like tetraheme cytochrome c subunit
MTSPDSRQPAPPAANAKHPLMAIFTSHWLAMLGVGLVLTGIVLWLTLLSARLKHGEENPYIGLAMTGAGIVLILGAAITPLGLYLGRRRVMQRFVASNNGGSVWRRLFVFLAITSLLNIVIASQTTEHVVHAMESRQFCGSCHVMTPESRAFTQGQHAGLQCVDCHVGNGTVGFVKSKVQGTRQLIHVLTNSVQLPIETAIESGRMVPSAQTCEECHWKQRPASAKMRLIQKYADDEANTPDTTVLTMNVGGSIMGGIHGAHNGEGVEIHFVATDKRRQDIPLVEYRNTKTGESRTYVKKGASAASFDGQPRIAMQCFDCHNRAAHIYQLPERAVDEAITLGRISSSLPYVKKASIEILKKEYPSSDAAASAIPAALAAYYDKSNTDVARTRASDIRDAGAVLADIYSRNVFPDLRVTWGTYPNNLGHQDYPGCFRCHDDDHVNDAGKAITKNCFVCHFPSAVGDDNPEVLKLLGVDRMLEKLQKKTTK